MRSQTSVDLYEFVQYFLKLIELLKWMGECRWVLNITKAVIMSRGVEHWMQIRFVRRHIPVWI